MMFTEVVQRCQMTVRKVQNMDVVSDRSPVNRFIICTKSASCKIVKVCTPYHHQTQEASLFFLLLPALAEVEDYKEYLEDLLP